MFDWLMGRQSPPTYLIELKLHETKPHQKAAIGEMQAWIDELLTVHKFRFDPVASQIDSYDVRLIRNEDDPEWLRCTVEFRLYVEEDQRDMRLLGGHCSVLVDCSWKQLEESQGIGMEAAFSKEAIANAKQKASAFFAQIERAGRN